ncbi:MAG: hypothetical protein UX02_C0002G0002 [Candidatus Moranbacteria bacterium GW2011_GWC1_45_18]|nr:MAG: Transposase [Candidatus Moranbacteria bacterium GW2011_GWF2_44_10]KKT99683.1 MAG: hypothetical protein UX02_C0002G0002 [Candidatus Moranbacteria bacterium GW2011_GWC1_45_18]OGI40239.1 MAG: hypothetical protein A2374_00710 [Candidatus Moranbacteria bacterium RIFOXYB1_FULL_44_23]HBB36506.1 hypothetical protein [Candidatus Moranbacteria bacterium]HBU25272.1 hypothetical protein [Candidatus Moranbacteria bacterium]
MRKNQIVKNEFYHIYNRGTEKRKIFLDDSDYFRFLFSMRLMNDEKDGLMFLWKNHHAKYPKATLDEFLRSNLKKPKPLVEFICYSLMPNHVHFVMRQIAEKGIEKFMHRIGTGYTMYFNSKYQRSGVLFQGKFKASRIGSGNFLYLSAYVNCNAEVHGIAKARNWRWSSFSDYLGETKSGLCNKKVVMMEFKGAGDYEKFAKENVEAARQNKANEKLTLE